MTRVKEDPALPLWWGKNQAGMQAREEVDLDAMKGAQDLWLESRDQMLAAVKKLSDLGLHKQLANRLIEPWMFITVLVSATEFDNFFFLRDHEDAQPEIAWIARDMKKKYEASTPQALEYGQWHMPLVEPYDYELAVDYLESTRQIPQPALVLETLRKVSVGRCARVSYLTHDGKRDVEKDVGLFNQLRSSGHWSPFEHVAMALDEPRRTGNFVGWRQFRKDFADEHHGGPMP